jgi:hypothetical protein
MNTKPVDSVKVRMYRHGFGDCFLLSFFHQQQRVFSMLVDCGIKHNTRSKTVPIEDVIGDLKETLKPPSGGKPKIDVLVATHEHWDHVSFFHPDCPKDGSNFFSDFDIRQIWLAWTEDPEDEEAVAINSRLRKGAAALREAALRFHEVEAEESNQFRGLAFGRTVAEARTAFNTALNDVLGFYGLSVAKKTRTSRSGIKYKTNSKVSVETEVAMTNIVKLGKKGGVIYLNPGTKVEPPRLPAGVRAYVLGPPRSSMINKSNPSSGRAKETYLGIYQTGLTGFIDGILRLASSSKANGATNEAEGPFGKGAGLTPRQAENHPYFKQTYFAKDESYRQIEHAWLDAVGQFSLQLDGAINNTSLVLAIELEESGNVLLFPGDAQVGSWLSWHEHQWQVKRGDKTETITAKDLLKNTVLYKVSHHGSHNATVKDRGLELMTHPDLVAMIPEKEKSYNGILYKPLIDRLRKLCKGRVLISADVDYPPEDLLTKRPPELPAAEWKSFKADLTVERLYVEYTIR